MALRDLEDEEKQPDDSITSDYDPEELNDLDSEEEKDLGAAFHPHAMLSVPSIKEMIAKRKGIDLMKSGAQTPAPMQALPSGATQSAPNPYLDSQTMQELGPEGPMYASIAKDLKEGQDQNAHMLEGAGYAAAFQQAARGANEPVKSELPSILERGAQSALQAQEKGASLKEKIAQSIQARKAKEAQLQGLGAYRGAQLDLAKQRIGATNALRSSVEKNRTDRLEGMNISRAMQAMHDPAIVKATTQLNAARNVDTLIDEIRSGKLTDSKNIRNQLTNMIVQIEQGGGGTGEDRAKMGIDTLYSKLKDLESYYSGKPKSSITPEYLDQIQSEASALGGRAAKNYQTSSDAIMAGADLSGGNPDVNPGRVMQLIKQRRDKFLQSTGFDPETGEKIKKPGSESNQAPKTIKHGNKTYSVGDEIHDYKTGKTWILQPDGITLREKLQ